MNPTVTDWLLALSLICATYGVTNALLRLAGRTAARVVVAVLAEVAQ